CAVFKRLSIGALKGLVAGVVVGSVFQLGLGFVRADGLLGYLMAMASALTIAIWGGRPPWKQVLWIEASLRAAGGLVIGAAVHWGLGWVPAWTLPSELTGAAATTPALQVPLLLCLVLALVMGILIELDHDGADTAAPRGKPKAAPTRNAA